MYAHLTTYDSTRHLASLARRGAFDRPQPADDLKPVARTSLRSRLASPFARLRRHGGGRRVVTRAPAPAGA